MCGPMGGFYVNIIGTLFRRSGKFFVNPLVTVPLAFAPF